MRLRVKPKTPSARDIAWQCGEPAAEPKWPQQTKRASASTHLPMDGALAAQPVLRRAGGMRLMEPLTFSTQSRLDGVLYTRETTRGTPYAVGLATDNEGRRHTILAAGEDIDPDHFRLLEGQDLALRVTENGVRVRPIAEQPPGVQNHLIAMLEREEPPVEDRNDPPEARHGEHGTPLPRLTELAMTVAQQAAELGLPTAMWVHLPSG